MEPGGGQALEEAEKIKQERGDDFEIWWQLDYGPNDAQYHLPEADPIPTICRSDANLPCELLVL